jgi:predicted nucleotide-binding protein
MMTKEDKLAKLQRMIDWADMLSRTIVIERQLVSKPLFDQSDDFKSWHNTVQETIKVVFNRHSHYIDDFNEIKFRQLTSTLLGKTEELQREYLKGLDKSKALLTSMLRDVQEQPAPEAVALERSKAAISGRAGRAGRIFIGHGRSPLWARLQVFLEGEVGLRTITYESEARAGASIVAILEQMLNDAVFAVLILTAEDETGSGSRRARQNVVHEAGLFQGRLGFNKAILLVQEGLEEFSNVDGLQHLSFSGARIDQTFYELQRVLRREGLM